MLLLGIQVQATHIMGMNISYEHISGDSFLIYSDFYRYCGGTAFNNGNCTGAAGIGLSMNYRFYCVDNGFSTANITANTDSIFDVSPICPSEWTTSNSCISGSCGLLGIQHATYLDTVVLDSNLHGGIQCDDWLMIYATGLRNSGVNYVGQPSIVSYARINMLNGSFNSSVKLEPNNPVPVLCEGQEVYYGWSAYDPDGDSLFWRLDTAWNNFNYSTGAFSSIPYNTIIGYDTFSGLDPMPGDVTINHETGELHFTADIPPGYNYANYAVAILVEEYDFNTGAFKGSVHRDIQFIVTDSCENLPPTSTAGIMNLDGGYLIDSVTIGLCDSAAFQFDIIVSDFDTNGNLSGDSLTTTCNIGQIIPNATYTTTGTNPDTVHFTCPNYIPSQGQVMFTVMAEDNFCPVTAVRTFTFFIESTQSTYLMGDTSICDGDQITLNAHSGDTFLWTVINGEPIQVGSNFGCLGCQTPWVSPSITTTYAVESNIAPVCGNSDTVTVTVSTSDSIELTTNNGGLFGPNRYCATESSDSILANLSGGTFTGSGVNSTTGVFDPQSISVASGGLSSVPITYSTGTGCQPDEIIVLEVKGLPIASIVSSDSIHDTINLYQFGAAGSSGIKSWYDASNSGNPTANGQFDATLFTAPDSLMIYLNVDDSGCVNRDSMLVYIVNDSITGVETKSIIESVVWIYPNPTRGEVTVRSSEIMTEIRLVDERGRVELVEGSGKQIELDMSNFSPGLYFMEVIGQKGIIKVTPIVLSN
ncbi:MAG: hypothetical protein Salg2KO_11110 [Salibacteraceae bacterium]